MLSGSSNCCRAVHDSASESLRMIRSELSPKP
jgi:hypothetical protein